MSSKLTKLHKSIDDDDSHDTTSSNQSFAQVNITPTNLSNSKSPPLSNSTSKSATQQEIQLSASKSYSTSSSPSSSSPSPAISVTRADPWWKSTLVYQIYPSSFSDSNNDGIGDLRGIESKLDYLSNLGVDVIWISPVYKSPMRDMGYDISDYRDIDPRYGSIKDWDNLVKGLHARGMKMMMDLVVNHTSDEHEWFKESRKSKTNSKRSWYIWQPPKYDKFGNRRPPNNWKSVFQGSAWEWDEVTEEYYLHLYHIGQPDLNWENPDVRKAVWDLMKFWLDRGTDGFRMDVINLISKVPGFPDAPISDKESEWQNAAMYYANGPRVHEFLQEMNQEVLSKYPDIITVGEAPFTHDMEALAEYVLPERKELNMIFSFELVDVDNDGKSRENALNPRVQVAPLRDVKEVISRWQRFMHEEGFWNSIYVENHDQPRSVSRFTTSEPKWRSLSAKLLALLQISQKGTLYIYQGQEIGMGNVPRSWGIEEFKDTATLRYWERKVRERGEGADMSDVFQGIQRKARDNGRTPMQWNASLHAGFSDGTPWMRVNDDYIEWNVAKQENDPQSVLNFWRSVIKLRKANPTLIFGDFYIVDEENEHVFSFFRILGRSALLVVLNFTQEDQIFHVPEQDFLRLPTPFTALTALPQSKCLVSNYFNSSLDQTLWPGGSISLRPFEGRIYEFTT